MKAQNLHKHTFKASGTSYNLDLSKWRSSQKKKHKRDANMQSDNQRILHSSIILKNSLYVFGGIPKSADSAIFSSLSFRTNQWKHWENCENPCVRDSFGLTVHKNEIYLFGGSNMENHFGDLHIFNTFNCAWKEVEVSQKIIPRDPMIFTNVDDEFIFLCGGVNVEKKKLLDDCHIYKDGTWIQLQSISYPSCLTGAKGVSCGNKIFMFGGQCFGNHKDKGEQCPYENKRQSVFQIVINLENLTAQFIQKEYKETEQQRPCGRVNHQMLAASPQYFLVLGGQQINNLSEHNLLRDIWYYEVNQGKWHEIEPVNGPMRSLSCFSASLSNHSLYLIGGITENYHTFNDQILVLEFAEEALFKPEICSSCVLRAHQNQSERKSFPKYPVVTVGFLYNLCLEIKHPFQAIGMLYRAAVFLKSSYFIFSTHKTLNQFDYLTAQFDGDTLSLSKFQQLIYHSNSERNFYEFILNIKLGSLRLGKTLIYITANGQQRKVYMISADSKISPAFDETFGYYAYVQNIKSESIQSRQGRIHKSLILNVLQSRIKHPEQLLQTKSGNKIYIFETNILMTASKTYYYELISYNMNDISVFKNIKKIKFLDDLGYELSYDPEISLRAYASHLILHEQGMLQWPRFCINSDEYSVEPNNYLQKLQQMKQKGLISEVMLPFSKQLEVQAAVYASECKTLVKQNHGLLLYYNNQLINRYGATFSNLFKEEFFKQKYKEGATVFKFLGVINIKQGLNPNILFTSFKKSLAYYNFLEALNSQFRKKQTRLTLQDIDEKKIMKKVKLN